MTLKENGNLKPFQPTHPGEVLKEELEFRGISQRGLAKKLGISYSALNENSIKAIGGFLYRILISSSFQLFCFF